MASRRRASVDQFYTESQMESTGQLEDGETDMEQPARVLTQVHKVHVGDRIQLNGALFNVVSNQYAWHMVCPDGTEGALTCADMPSPYFTPNQVGDYTITLHTDDGMVEITVQVEA